MAKPKITPRERIVMDVASLSRGGRGFVQAVETCQPVADAIMDLQDLLFFRSLTTKIADDKIIAQYETVQRLMNDLMDQMENVLDVQAEVIDSPRVVIK